MRSFPGKYLPFLRIALVVLVWFLFVLSLFFAASHKLTYNSVIGTPPTEGPAFFKTAAHWDSGYYLNIAKDGYLPEREPSQYAFFPLYPYLMRAASHLTGSLMAGGLLVNLISLALAAAGLWAIARRLFDEGTGWRSTLLLLVFPSAYFFVGIYGEALFLALSVGAYLATLHKKWWIAAVLAGLASANRVPGILVGALVALAYLESDAWKLTWQKVLQALALFLVGISGLVAYLAFLVREVGSFAQISAIYKEFWPDRMVSLNYPRTFWHWLRDGIWYFRSEQFAAFFDWLLPVGLFVLAVGLLIWGWRRLPKSLVIFTALNLILLASTSTYDSINRYLAPLFPLYLLLALTGKSERRFSLIFAAMAILMGYLAASFATNFWTG